jgi:Kef-type K+ transport system membrane component KefB/mannitol/fructose-specific phosphotransferase system IIA component
MSAVALHPNVVLFLALGVTLAAARALGEIARGFRQPAVLGEILAGIVLGPTVLGALLPGGMQVLFPAAGPAAQFLSGFHTVAIALFLLGAGMEVNLSSVVRQGRAAISISLLGLVAPFALGFAAGWLAPPLFGAEPDSSRLVFALFFATALSISALPVIVKTLMDLNLLRTDLGVLVVAAAMFQDLVGWLVFALVLGLMSTAPGALAVGETVLLTLGFVAAMLTAGRWVVHRTLPWIHAYTAWPGGVLTFSFSLAFLCAAFTEWIGIHAIFGAFIAGVVIGDSTHLREQTRATIDQFVSNIFAPLFFASLGLRVDFLASFHPAVVLAVLGIAIAGKLLGCRLGGWLARMPARDSWAIGFAMNSRGAVEIILATVALQAGLIRERLFVALVVMALVTSMMSGPLMQWVLRRPTARRVADFLGARTFHHRVAARTAEEAIAELAPAAAEAAGLPVPVVRDAVQARELLMSTALGNGVAVPHARLPGLARPVVCVGLSGSGVEFDAADRQPAHLIVLLLTAQDDEGAQLELIADVARIFSRAEMRQAAQRAETFTQFLALLRTGQAV